MKCQICNATTGKSGKPFTDKSLAQHIEAKHESSLRRCPHCNRYKSNSGRLFDEISFNQHLADCFTEQYHPVKLLDKDISNMQLEKYLKKNVAHWPSVVTARDTDPHSQRGLK